MNKKLLKIVAIASTVLMATAPAASLLQSTPTVLAASLKQKTVKMAVYKYSKNHKSHTKSMAQTFIGNKVKLTIKNRAVTKMVIHVDGKNSPMGKNQNVNKIVKSLKINGANGKKENVAADNSSFDFVFSGKAFKNNGWVKMNVTIDFGGKMREAAWIKFSKISGVKTAKKANKKTKKAVSKKRNSKKVSKKRSHAKRK